AMDLNRAMGGSTWLAHTAYEYGRMLLTSGDRTRATPLVAEAIAIAESVGMPTLLARARALGVGGTTTVTAPDELSGREVDVLRLVRSEEHTSELQSPDHLVCRLLLETKKR